MHEMTHGHLVNAIAWVARKIDENAKRRWNSESLFVRQAMLAREWDRRFCLLHEDCRNVHDIGAACRAHESAA